MNDWKIGLLRSLHIFQLGFVFCWFPLGVSTCTKKYYPCPMPNATDDSVFVQLADSRHTNGVSKRRWEVEKAWKKVGCAVWPYFPNRSHWGGCLTIALLHVSADIIAAGTQHTGWFRHGNVGRSAACSGVGADLNIEANNLNPQEEEERWRGSSSPSTSWPTVNGHSPGRSEGGRTAQRSTDAAHECVFSSPARRDISSRGVGCKWLSHRMSFQWMNCPWRPRESSCEVSALSLATSLSMRSREVKSEQAKSTPVESSCWERQWTSI